MMVDTGDVAPTVVACRRRAPPGERRVQILRALAEMLEAPGAERVTTAALAARVSLSEAALYRHFASKAQMFDGLIEFVESSVFALVDPIVEHGPAGGAQAVRIVRTLLQFGERNPGMTRLMVGDALVYEHERLGARMNRFFDRVESQLRSSLLGEPDGAVDPAVHASVLTAFCIGRLQRYARSGFRRLPTEHLEAAGRLLGGGATSASA